jgi:hypothetical protein
MDMRFHWLCSQELQGQYCFYWRPGTQNLADYWAKHHPTSHHKSFCPQILTSAPDPQVPQSDYSKEHCYQVFRQDYPNETIFCGTIGCKTKDTCSPMCLIAQQQGCIRLTVSPSHQKDIYLQVSCQKDIYSQTGQVYMAMEYC